MRSFSKHRLRSELDRCRTEARKHNMPFNEAAAEAELIKKLAADGVMDSLSVNTELLGLVGCKSTAEVTTKDDLRNAKIIIVTGASLAGNQITLPAGVYRIKARAPAQSVNRNRARIYTAIVKATLHPP